MKERCLVCLLCLFAAAAALLIYVAGQVLQ